MAHVKTHMDVDLDSPVLVEGLPGVGLVGKIAADHLIDVLDMDLYGTVHCDELAPVGVYHEGERAVQPPVRVYVAPEEDLLVLQSEVPVNAEAVREFANCFTGWVAETDVLPIYMSGLATEDREMPPAMHAVATSGAVSLVEDMDIDSPPEGGVISGPTGALVNRAFEHDLDSVGVVVESDPKFPDPAASRILIERAVAPIAGISVDVGGLVDHADEIRTKKEQLASSMQDAKEEETSQAQRLRMYQ